MKRNGLFRMVIVLSRTHGVQTFSLALNSWANDIYSVHATAWQLHNPRDRFSRPKKYIYDPVLCWFSHVHLFLGYQKPITTWKMPPFICWCQHLFVGTQTSHKKSFINISRLIKRSYYTSASCWRVPEVFCPCFALIEGFLEVPPLMQSLSCEQRVFIKRRQKFCLIHILKRKCSVF
jgi:hypothetical protein